MDKTLTDNVAVVTGASSGIGRATAYAMAEAGAQVVVTARRTDRIEAVVRRITEAGGEAVAVTADVTNADDVDHLYEVAINRFGRVDILFNNAGVSAYGPLDTITVEDYDWMMNTNMRSSFPCTRRFLPDMLARRRSQICFLASVAGLKGLPNETVYCASKFAQVGFAQALDYETRESGVRVSVVAPGGVHTEFAIGTGRTEGDPALDAMMEPEDIAEAMMFALTQPEKARTFLIGMRPMSEPL
ncbi:MAG: SDR family oxidoreductase [Actinomycetota bacterium]|nr:SDR family oxidoreductase [Actinomycetota bacterium]MDK1292401.1 SDR family oxidoreductase [Actinomycetota bacterium]